MKTSLSDRLGRWFAGRIDTLTRLRLLLLLLVMWFISRGLAATTRFAAPGWMGATLLAAVLLGWLLGRARLPGWKSALAAGVSAPLWLLLTMGRLGAPIIALCGAFPPVPAGLLRPPHTPDFAPFLAALSVLGESAESLFNRFVFWFGGLQASTRVGDPVVEGLLWGLAVFSVSAWAGWWLRRKGQVEVGLLPGSALLTVAVFNGDLKKGITWLVLAAGGWLLIHALEQYALARNRWQKLGMDRAEVEPGLAGGVALLALTAMLAGSFIPTISFEKIARDIQEYFQAQGGEVGEAGQGGGAAGGSASYSRLNITGGQELPQDIVMLISVEGYDPPPESDRGRFGEAPQPEVQYYWRSATFRSYSGRGWTSFTSREEDYSAGAALFPDPGSLPATSRLVRQEVVRLDLADEMVYTAGELLRLDQPYTVLWRWSNEEASARTQADSYTAESLLQVVTVDQLRAASGGIPTLIQDQYLQLPATLPDRIYDLAISLTVDLENPYDRIIAIQDYIRQFPYNLHVPSPPANRDAVDFFLFDLQQGYCNYTASAMTVLARAVGLPARLVTGYLSGSFDTLSGQFVVREENSHAWVEVWFPGIGWVEFEPTQGVPVFYRPGGAGASAPLPEAPQPAPEEPALTRFYGAVLRNPLTALGILLGLTLLVSLLPLRDWSLHLHPAEKTLRIIFHRLYRLGYRWGIPRDASRTPLEFSRLLAARLESAPRRSRPPAALLPADLHALTLLYTRMLFSRFHPGREERRSAIRLWMRLRRGLRRGRGKMTIK